MNVNCQRSQELFNNNNDKFGNLKLGPQLMKDIKKMLTHPMRNPYDKSVMKSNLIVMQDYKPPFGQMFPNGALIAGPDRSPNSVYVPAKQVQSNYNAYNTFNGNVFAASTPSPSYVPPAFNSISPSQRDAEVFQRQRQNGQYVQSNRIQNTQQSGNIISNGHTAQYTQGKNTAFSNGNSNLITRTNQNYNQQYNQQANSFVPTQSYTQNAITAQRGQINRQNGQYTDNRAPTQSNNGKQSQFGVSFTKQQYNYNPNQDKQGYTNQSPLPLSNENTGQVNTEAKQNLVSNNGPAAIITKTLTFNRIVEPKPGNPKSRITFKTWIVKPSKAAKLIAEPTPYTYPRPTNPTAAKLVDGTTPYVYNKPSTVSQAARIIQPDDGSYRYNKPTVAAKQISEPDGSYVYNKPTLASKQVSDPNDGSYIYNKPTIAAKQIVREPPRLYLTPTAPPPTLSGRLYLAPTSPPPPPPPPPPPTIASRLYIAPTTYKPAANLYIPPSQSNVILSRQYLAPSAIQQPAYYQSEQLRASPTSPTPSYAAPTNDNANNPSFSLTKQSRINANHNNLTFADILTKEKLDITVNDIVSDTSDVLKTAAPQFDQYRQDKSVDYVEENYLPPDTNNESDENLTPQSPTVATSSRLIVDPSRELEPPLETVNSNNDVQNTNRLTSLPFYKEPTNTIERTVSLKISIPEKVASYLFKSRNESDFDKLEILNTGSSNYLVLTNNLLRKNTGASFIPIGRLIANQNTNISDSQALVFNFLADSLNVAKEYSNLAQQNIINPTAPTQFQNVNTEDLSRITNQISQLTASQYSENQNHANIVSTASTTTNGVYPYRAAKYTNNIPQNQAQQNQRAQISIVPSQQTFQGYAARLQSPNNGLNLQNNQNQIYSGQLYQLPVPDVTSQIYNAGAAKLQDSNVQRQSTQSGYQRGSNQNSNVANNRPKQSSAEVEIVQSQTLPLPAAKLQFAPSNEPESFNSQEHSAQTLLGNFLNNGNGISAQLRDKIFGTLPHPLEENKLLTYKKDESYYLYTKLNNNLSNTQTNVAQSNNQQQNAKLIQGTNTPNVVSFQFVPSVSYQLEDEKEQQKILNTFQIDQFGSPKKANLIQNNRRQEQTSDVNYSVEHPTSKQLERQYNEINNLYTGPSSYSAPQASVGSLENRQNNARLEQFEENNGYTKVTPARQFTF